MFKHQECEKKKKNKCTINSIKVILTFSKLSKPHNIRNYLMIINQHQTSEDFLVV